MEKLKPVDVATLNARQKENYNFQKVAATLADYGFNCLRLTDDWEGADFIACHVDGETFLKVQMKGRLTVDKKYCGKNIYVAFIEGKTTYLYPHDTVWERVRPDIKNTESFKGPGRYSWPRMSKKYKAWMLQYSLNAKE